MSELSFYIHALFILGDYNQRHEQHPHTVSVGAICHLRCNSEADYYGEAVMVTLNSTPTMKNIPVGIGHYPAQKDWQSTEAAAEYRRKRDPKSFHRYAKEEAIINAWLDDLPAGALVLDVPCGTGRFVNTITRRGFRYLGADISEAMIGEARQQSGSGLVQDFIHADASNLPLEDNEVDCVIIWRLLHHIQDPTVRQAILREAARVSRRKVLVSFHHPMSFTALRKKMRRRFFGKGNGTEFTHWALAREAAECGLQLVETKGFRKYVSINWFGCLVKMNSPTVA